jgi:hypothetical protein
MSTELHVIKRGMVAFLRDNVENNIERYVSGDFSSILTPEYVIPVKGTSVDLMALSKLDPKSGGGVDVSNAKLVFSSINGLSRYLARDERLWVWFTHIPCLGYARNRWLTTGSKDKLVSQIRTHFFATGERGFERNNAVACLWWWSKIASQYTDDPLDKVLEVLLHQTDVRASIIERPTITQPAFRSIMKVLVEQYDADPEHRFFKRRGNQGLYKKWLAEINRYAGVRMYEAFSDNSNTELFRKLASEVCSSVEPVTD